MHQNYSSIMDKNHCSQLSNLPANPNDIYHNDRYICKITGQRCIASRYEDPDPGSSLSMGFVAYYHDNVAQATCPAYNFSDTQAKQLRLFMLLAEREKTRSKQAAEISVLEEEIKKLKAE